MKRTNAIVVFGVLLAGLVLSWPWATAGCGQPVALGLSTLRVGVSPSAMPLGNGTRDYTDDGLEAVYARELATQLGAMLELMPVQADAQAQALEHSQVDVVLARQAKGETWPATVQTLSTGFQSGLSVAMRSDTTTRDWQDLAVRTVCTTEANQRAQALARSLGGKLQVLNAPAQALAQLRTGACDAAVFDRALLNPLFKRREWEKFSATLAPRSPARMVAAISRSRPELMAAVRASVLALGSKAHWDKRQSTWAANVAFEVYFDQAGPDCH